MKKKIISLLLVAIMFFSVLTGCGLVSRDDQRYYEAVVATIDYTDGTKDNITKRELLTAYRSYGQNYVSNYGYTVQEAVEYTLETVINNYITRKAVVDHYKEINEGVFNGKEQTYLFDQTYDAVLSNLRSYLDGYKSSSEENSDANKNASVFVPYESKVESINTATGVITTKESAKTIREDYTARVYSNAEEGVEGVFYDLEYVKDGKYFFQELMYDNLNEFTTIGDAQSKKAWQNAFSRYIAVIKSNYSYYTKTDREWMVFEINRVYKILRDNYMISKYETIFNEREHSGANISLSSVQDVLNAYADKVVADYTTYKIQNKVSTFESDILNSTANVDYILDNGSEYFYVAPIKINLLDGETDTLAELKTQLIAGEIDPDAYTRQVNAIWSKDRKLVSVRNAETGEVEDTMTISELAGRIANKNVDVDEYKKYFYRYNDEDTYKNADYNAVFGVNSNGEVLTKDIYSNDNIKQAIASLYNNGNARVGDTTELVQVDDGWYIFFYAGRVENLINGVTEHFEFTNNEQISILRNAKINVFSEKTVFDVVYDGLSTSDDFASFQNMNINNLRTNKTTNIRRFENNLKDLYK